MPSVAELLRRPDPAALLFIEHDGLRGGPFAELHDPDRLLDLPPGSPPPGYRPLPAPGPRGRLALRRGLLRDPFLRRRLAARDLDPAALEIVLADRHGRVLARWHLTDLHLLEVVGGRPAAPERYDYLLLDARLEATEGPAPSPER